MKRAFALAALALAACGDANRASAGADPDSRIECRSGDAVGFERICTLESVETADGRILTIRKADGGFRRLRVAAGGGVVAADGAERARVTPLPGDRIEVAIGGDRFRLPATVRAR